jgi:hypothetical protein
MHAQGAYKEICPLDRWPATVCSYIVCSDDRTVSATWSKAAARERLGVEPIVIAGGHCPHVSRPDELADVLVKLCL